MNRKGLKQLLENYTSVKVFPDFIREKQPLPAVAFDHSFNGRDRVMVGKSSGRWDTWRITIIGDTRQQCDDVTSELELMDGANDANFQSVMILGVTDEPVGNLDKQYRTSIEVRTYDR